MSSIIRHEFVKSTSFIEVGLNPAAVGFPQKANSRRSSRMPESQADIQREMEVIKGRAGLGYIECRRCEALPSTLLPELNLRWLSFLFLCVFSLTPGRPAISFLPLSCLITVHTQCWNTNTPRWCSPYSWRLVRSSDSVIPHVPAYSLRF